MTRFRAWVWLLAGLFLPMATAAPVVVEVVQYPAWIERGGVSAPLVPGTQLRGRDRVRTGEEARVRLRFADGSTVKLGENAHFEIDRVQETGFLRASLRVLEGAFRYATDAARAASRREVTIKARNVTVGIRGTDVWGRSTDERSLVCLIEGVISVGAEGHPTVRLDQPLDFYDLRRGAPPTVQKVDPKQLALWALETETSDDAPVARAAGPWRVNVAQTGTRDEALAIVRTLRANGFPAGILGSAPGPYLVVIQGMAGDGEALAAIRRIRKLPGVRNPTVQKD